MDSKSKIEIKGNLLLKLITFYAEIIELKKIECITVPDDISDQDIHKMRRAILAKYEEAGSNNIRQITAEMEWKYYRNT